MSYKGFSGLSIVLGALLLSACEQDPDKWVRGYTLEGETTTTVVEDWSFTRDIQEIYIESTPWWQVPHSVTIWCFDIDGQLYVGSYRERKRWEDNVSGNSSIRLKIDGVIYAMEIGAQVQNQELIDRLDEVLETKYDLQAVFGNEKHQWWYYPVAQRTL